MLGGKIPFAVGEREQRAALGAEALDERQRAFTLVTNAYGQAQRGGTFCAGTRGTRTSSFPRCGRRTGARRARSPRRRRGKRAQRSLRATRKERASNKRVAPVVGEASRKANPRRARRSIKTRRSLRPSRSKRSPHGPACFTRSHGSAPPLRSSTPFQPQSHSHAPPARSASAAAGLSHGALHHHALRARARTPLHARRRARGHRLGQDRRAHRARREALCVGVPTLLLDVKGDLSNLLLAFPTSAPERYLPLLEGSPEDRAHEAARIACERRADLAGGARRRGPRGLLCAHARHRAHPGPRRRARRCTCSPRSSGARPAGTRTRTRPARRSLSLAVTLLLRLLGRESHPAVRASTRCRAPSPSGASSRASSRRCPNSCATCSTRPSPSSARSRSTRTSAPPSGAPSPPRSTCCSTLRRSTRAPAPRSTPPPG